MKKKSKAMIWWIRLKMKTKKNDFLLKCKHILHLRISGKIATTFLRLSVINVRKRRRNRLSIDESKTILNFVTFTYFVNSRNFLQTISFKMILFNLILSLWWFPISLFVNKELQSSCCAIYFTLEKSTGCLKVRRKFVNLYKTA